MAGNTMKCLLANKRDQIQTQGFLDSRVAEKTSVSPCGGAISHHPDAATLAM